MSWVAILKSGDKRGDRRFVLRKHDDMLRSSARARGASLGSRNGKIHQISAGVLDLGQAGGRVGYRVSAFGVMIIDRTSRRRYINASIREHELEFMFDLNRDDDHDDWKRRYGPGF